MKRLFGLCAALAVMLSSPAYASWLYTEDKDAISDALTARSFAAGDRGKIGIKCDEPGRDSLYVHFISNEYLGGRAGRYSDRSLTYRFDKDVPITTAWSYNDRSAILTNNSEISVFLSRLATASTLAIRTSDYLGHEATTIIDVSGASAQIERVATTCKAHSPTSSGV